MKKTKKTTAAKKTKRNERKQTRLTSLQLATLRRAVDDDMTPMVHHKCEDERCDCWTSKDPREPHRVRAPRYHLDRLIVDPVFAESITVALAEIAEHRRFRKERSERR